MTSLMSDSPSPSDQANQNDESKNSNSNTSSSNASKPKVQNIKHVFDPEKTELYLDMLAHYFEQYQNEAIFDHTPEPSYYTHYSQEDDEILINFIENYENYQKSKKQTKK